MAAVEELDSIAPLAAEWDDLADRAAAAPFLRPGWFEAWTHAFRPRGLRVLALRRGERLAAVVPLLRRRGGVAGAANWHSPLFGLLAEDAAAEGELAAALFRRGRRVVLPFLTEESAETCTAAARAAGAVTDLRTSMRSPYVPTAGGWDAYLDAVGRKRIKEVERRLRRLGEEGELRFELTDVLGRLEEGFRLEAAGWKGRQGTAIVSRPETRAFYTAVARWAAERDMLGLAFLSVGGRAVAFELTLQDGRRHYNLKGGYDEAYARHGPGGLIAYHLIRDSFERGFESFEFLGSDEPFKLQWTDRVRERRRLLALSGPGSRAELALWLRARPALQRLRTLGRR